MSYEYNTDAGAEMNYAAHDPQFADIEAEERESQRAALDEVVELLETVIDEVKAIKQNFVKRKYNTIIRALEEVMEEVQEVRDDV